MRSDGNKNGKKIDPISQKKPFLYMQHTFCTFLSEFPVEFAPLQRGTSRNFLVTRFMEEMLYVFLFSLSFFFQWHSFSTWWPQAFLIFSPPL